MSLFYKRGVCKVTKILMNKQSYSPDSMNLHLKHHNNITIWYSMHYSPVYSRKRQDEGKKNKIHTSIYNYNTSLYWADDINWPSTNRLWTQYTVLFLWISAHTFHSIILTISRSKFSMASIFRPLEKFIFTDLNTNIYGTCLSRGKTTNGLSFRGFRLQSVVWKYFSSETFTSTIEDMWRL
jgi:hypothetical protein